MPAALDAVAALKGGWAGVTDRASLDHAAVNVPASDLPGILGLLKRDHGFDMLVDISGVDWGMNAKPRFTVVYHVFSTLGHEYVRVAADCADDLVPEVPSVTPLWAGADWHEREAYDMFGIRFTGHPDLRRILMWDGYPYYPLRKDFPLEGLPTDLPGEEGFSRRAPMEGGPFVAAPTDKPPAIGDAQTSIREPRAKPADH